MLATKKLVKMRDAPSKTGITRDRLARKKHGDNFGTHGNRRISDDAFRASS
jgi:hypothetical protein